MEELRLVFMGTPEFALPSLEALYHSRHKVEAVVTQPDRPRGRGQKLWPTPVKKKALELGLVVAQPESLKDEQFLEYLNRLNPDLIIAVAYGNIIPSEILEMPPEGCINLHPSLLPCYRGASPIQSALLNGESVTGVSVIYMAPELDAGDIIMQEEEEIRPRDCTGDLHDRLARKGAEIILRSVDAIARGEARPEPQDHRQASYTAPLEKSDEMIDWKAGAEDIFNQVRALSPVPGATAFYQGRRVKVKKARLPRQEANGEPGEIIGLNDEGIEVATGNGTLVITRVQPEGKKEMNALDFWRGYRLNPGDTMESGK